jgi:hypothetical protein
VKVARLAASSIGQLYLHLNRLDEARDYFAALKKRVPSLPQLSDADRQNLLYEIEGQLKRIEQRLSTRPATSQPDK